jgi:hypothetical protein
VNVFKIPIIFVLEENLGKYSNKDKKRWSQFAVPVKAASIKKTILILVIHASKITLKVRTSL